MSAIFDEEEEQEEQRKNSNVTEFKLITGGKEPPEDGEPWLKHLSKGTHFLFRRKTKTGPEDIGVNRAVVIYQYDTSTLLFDNLNANAFFIVDTAGFSNIMRRVQIIGYEVPQQEEQDAVPGNDPNKDGDRSD